MLKELKLIGTYSFHKCCILKVFLTRMVKGHYVVFSMATDGKIALWDISEHVKGIVEIWNEENDAAGAAGLETTNEELEPFAVVKAHQSGINSFDSIRLDDDTILIGTGGDDCAIVLNRICISLSDAEKKMTAQVTEVWRNDFAHLSQITGK